MTLTYTPNYATDDNEANWSNNGQTPITPNTLNKIENEGICMLVKNMQTILNSPINDNLLSDDFVIPELANKEDIEDLIAESIGIINNKHSIGLIKNIDLYDECLFRFPLDFKCGHLMFYPDLELKVKIEFDFTTSKAISSSDCKYTRFTYGTEEEEYSTCYFNYFDDKPTDYNESQRYVGMSYSYYGTETHSESIEGTGETGQYIINNGIILLRTFK